MATATVCIGNSDDKLTQKRWSDYVSRVNEVIRTLSPQIFFQGYSDPRAPWQNACWVFQSIDVHDRDRIVTVLARLARIYDQEAIAFVVGDTFMIEPTE